MLRAMDSAVAGLRAHQNKLDVIGNNIANVNTFGYKAQNYSFKDAMYQTSSPSSAGKNSSAEGEENVTPIGGANAAQYGYGALTGSIATDFTSSTPSYVGGFNASINGSGFFVTNASDTANIAEVKNSSDMSSTIKTNSFAYTRVGQFSIDSNGYMVDSNKNFIYGFRPEGSLTEPSKYSNDLVPLRAPSAGQFTGVTNTTSSDANAAEELKGLESALVGRLNELNAAKMAVDEAKQGIPQDVIDAKRNVDKAEADLQKDAETAALNQGVSEADRDNFISSYKNANNAELLKRQQELTDAMNNAKNNGIEESKLTGYTDAVDKENAAQTAYNSAIKAVNDAKKPKLSPDEETAARLEEEIKNLETELKTAKKAGDADQVTVLEAQINGKNDELAKTKTAIATAKAEKAKAEAETKAAQFNVSDTTFSQAAIQLTSVTIGNDGIIKATFDNNGVSASIILGKVAIANFQNQEGLMKAGNNAFNAANGDNTGIVTVTEPGGATSTLMSGYLEASNVDLAKEFSDMITTQRGFQANSKIITVSDEVLQELVNMKR